MQVKLFAKRNAGLCGESEAVGVRGYGYNISALLNLLVKTAQIQVTRFQRKLIVELVAAVQAKGRAIGIKTKTVDRLINIGGANCATKKPVSVRGGKTWKHDQN